ncbi:MAG: rod-binding protein [Candidatus Caenarcaniphilales bacterium]|jgi:Rod binding domain-containing protein|nr:rod-binding protein [Candidatus Caenarcaniphilales bacterium]
MTINNLNLNNLTSSMPIEKPNSTLEDKKKAAQDFESLYLQISLKEMRPKLEGGLFNSGLAEEVYREFLDEALAKEISKSDTMGLQESLIKQMD